MAQSRLEQARKINVLLTTFAGLSCQRTTCIPFAADATVSDVYHDIYAQLPSHAREVILSGIDNQLINPCCDDNLASLVANDGDFITLQIRGRLLGGKGGFGSQLRAAGGRMSSRKNKNNQQDVNASNRNLDGRRLRTITEAKNLAEYLATKPEMDRKEREERRKRWESVIELAEKKQDELRDGKNKVRLDGDWVDAKEEAENKTRDAVMSAMKAADMERSQGNAGSDTSAGSGAAESSESGPSSSSSLSNSAEQAERPAVAGPSKTFFGWDDDDDMLSEDEDEEEIEPLHEPVLGNGKGKAIAT